MDVVSSDTLKELAKLYYDYCQNHQGDLYPLYLMLYKVNYAIRSLILKEKKKNINKDFEC